jgi:hypothetical protein
LEGFPYASILGRVTSDQFLHLFRSVSGHQNNSRRAAQRLDALHKLNPTHSRHDDVDKSKINRSTVWLEQSYGVLSAGSREDVISAPSQRLVTKLQRHWVVVNNENRGARLVACWIRHGRNLITNGGREINARPQAGLRKVRRRAKSAGATLQLRLYFFIAIRRAGRHRLRYRGLDVTGGRFPRSECRV